MTSYWVLSVRQLLLRGMLPIVVGMCVGWTGWTWKTQSSEFVENLRPVEGRILRFESASSGLNLDVEYLDETGVRYSNRFQVDSGMESELRTVGKISLVYDTRDPRRVELGSIVTANYQMLLDGGVLLAGGLLLLGGFAYILYRARQVAAIGRLFQRGQVVQTEVRDNTFAPGKRIGRFTYAFRGPGGRWFEGRSPELPANQLEEWPVGRSLLAAYDPADPRRNEPDIFGVVDARRRSAPQSA